MLYNQKSKRKLDNNNKNNPHQQLNIHALAPQLQELRVIKSEAELGVMRTVGSLSGKAFQETMQHTSPNSSEHYLSSVIEFGVKKRGAFSLAYVPVVAGGKRALTLHYVKNNEVLKDGEMVLMDAGGLFGGYCADITRTWPANGVFSQAQRHVYELVLAANKQGIQVFIYSMDICFGMCDDIFKLPLLSSSLRNAMNPLVILSTRSTLTALK